MKLSQLDMLFCHSFFYYELYSIKFIHFRWPMLSSVFYIFEASIVS